MSVEVKTLGGGKVKSDCANVVVSTNDHMKAQSG